MTAKHEPGALCLVRKPTSKNHGKIVELVYPVPPGKHTMPDGNWFVCTKPSWVVKGDLQCWGYTSRRFIVTTYVGTETHCLIPISCPSIDTTETLAAPVATKTESTV